MNYSDLSLQEKREMYDKLQTYFAGKNMTIDEVDKIIEKMTLDEKLEAIKHVKEIHESK